MTPKISENFANKVDDMIDNEKHRCAEESHSFFDDEYAKIFSPTVFETVEICTSIVSPSSSISDKSETNLNSIHSNSMPIVDEVDFSPVEMSVDALDNLEPGTYTLDVLEPGDFDLDAVLVESNTILDSMPIVDISSSAIARIESIENIQPVITCDKKTCREIHRKSAKTRNTNVQKITDQSRDQNTVTAREFVNSFSKDLNCQENPPTIRKDTVDESTSLSWLIDFKISSIFRPVEHETESSDKSKKKANDAQKKPRYTYTELIEQALKENGELTVSGIYSWISSHYPYYQQNDDRWKNSVRHNLSINPQFRKGKKASQGAGHFWIISDCSSQCSQSNNNEKSGSTTNPVTELINQIDEEVLLATRSIVQNAAVDFNDVSFHENESCHKMSTEESASSFVNTTSTDIEHLWECVQESHHQRFVPFMSDESTNLEDENFFIQDIHNSICLGDELFTNGLNSPYYNLSAIEI